MPEARRALGWALAALIVAAATGCGYSARDEYLMVRRLSTPARAGDGSGVMTATALVRAEGERRLVMRTASASDAE